MPPNLEKTRKKEKTASLADDVTLLASYKIVVFWSLVYCFLLAAISNHVALFLFSICYDQNKKTLISVFPFLILGCENEKLFHFRFTIAIITYIAIIIYERREQKSIKDTECLVHENRLSERMHT